MIFTPHKSIVQDISEHDRPFAAYLYAGLGVKKVYASQQILKIALQLGVIGPLALGKDLQNLIHDIYNFTPSVGWKYQIKNALGVNLSGHYTKQLIPSGANYFDVSWMNSLRVGTVFTDATSGFYGRLGFNKLQKISNSIAYNTHLNNNTTKSVNEVESMLYYKMTVTYALYDATIQGSFLNTTSPVTYTVNPFRFDFEIGFLFTLRRINLGYAYHFHTSKLENLRFPNGNSYGSIRIQYLF